MTANALNMISGLRTELLKDGATVLLSGTPQTASYPCLVLSQRGGAGSRPASPWSDMDVQVSIFAQSRKETYDLEKKILDRLNKKRFATYGIDRIRHTGGGDLPVQEKVYQRVCFFKIILKEEV